MEFAELQKTLLNLKSLIWCVNKSRDKYNVDSIATSLRQGKPTEDIKDTTLGSNIKFLARSFRDKKDIEMLINGLNQITLSAPAKTDAHGKVLYEPGHYLQAVENIGRVDKGSYGVLCLIDCHLKGLFYVEKKGWVLQTIDTSQIRFIFGVLIRP